MARLSVTLFVLVIFMVNDRGDAIIDKMVKEGINKGVEMAEKMSNEVMGQGVGWYCDHGGEFGAFAAKGFGLLKCDEEHQGQDYCKFVDDAQMMHDMICCLGEEQRKEAMGIAIRCFQIPEPNKGQDCMKNWYNWIMGLKEVIDMVAKKSGRK